MKTYFLFAAFILFMFSNPLSAQLPHTFQPPPVNPGGNFTRSLIVDCFDEIITDITNGNPSGLEHELFNYIQKNYIGYIILSGLEHLNIFGNSIKEKSLREFLIHARDSIPGLKIGLGATDAVHYTITPLLNATTGSGCFSSGLIPNLTGFNYALNNTGINFENLNRSEMCKFFFKAAQFCRNLYNKNPGKFKFPFDSFFLEYRYWNYTTSLASMQNEFMNFKMLLSVMNILKCNFNCIRYVEAEFLPSEIFNQQAWTAIDQITEADPLMDKMMIPAYSNNAPGLFDQICKTMHFLTDRFSKQRSTFYIGMNAEDNSFSFCDTSLIPHNYLGDYLNGTISPNGNLYSVENMFLQKFNNPVYMCSSCSCLPFNGNHYSIANVYGNELAGSMWTPYSMMKANHLYRSKKVNEMESTNEIPARCILLDLNGKMIQSFSSMDLFSIKRNELILPAGIYFLKILYEDGRTEVKRIVF
jgi:hypothetical protein